MTFSETAWWQQVIWHQNISSPKAKMALVYNIPVRISIFGMVNLAHEVYIIKNIVESTSHICSKNESHNEWKYLSLFINIYAWAGNIYQRPFSDEVKGYPAISSTDPKTGETLMSRGRGASNKSNQTWQVYRQNLIHMLIDRSTIGQTYFFVKVIGISIKGQKILCSTTA